MDEGVDSSQRERERESPESVRAKTSAETNECEVKLANALHQKQSFIEPPHFWPFWTPLSPLLISSHMKERERESMLFARQESRNFVIVIVVLHDGKEGRRRAGGEREREEKPQGNFTCAVALMTRHLAEQQQQAKRNDFSENDFTHFHNHPAPCCTC